MRLIRLLIAIRLMRIGGALCDAALAVAPEIRPAPAHRVKASGLLPRR